jgi:hypothetical protein
MSPAGLANFVIRGISASGGHAAGVAGSGMAQEPSRSAGGAFIALAIFIGAAGGAYAGNATLGVLVGVVVGGIVAVSIWLRDRARIGE